SMWMVWPWPDSVSGEAGARLPPAGMSTSPARDPSDPSSTGPSPYGRATGPTTAAAAPSPNSAAVARSPELRNREYTSTPMTSAYGDGSGRPASQPTAADSPNTNPVQAAATSNAAARPAPSSACTRQAVEGPSSSGGEGARTSST